MFWPFKIIKKNKTLISHKVIEKQVTKSRFKKSLISRKIQRGQNKSEFFYHKEKIWKQNKTTAQNQID